MIAIGASADHPSHLSISRGRAEFSLPSSFVRLRRGERLYQEGERVEALFHIVTGVVKLYTTFLDGKQHIMSFSFPDDLIGLAHNGTHVGSAEALTPVTAYRMPMTAVNARLRSDPDLEFHLICQLSHELHQARCHATLLSRHRATARIGLFLQILEANQNARGVSSEEIYLPMKRSDIGAYVGISLEAVGRSFRRLANRGAITIRNRRYIQITNRAESRRPFLMRMVAIDCALRPLEAAAVFVHRIRATRIAIFTRVAMYKKATRCVSTETVNMGVRSCAPTSATTSP